MKPKPNSEPHRILIKIFGAEISASGWIGIAAAVTIVAMLIGVRVYGG